MPRRRRQVPYPAADPAEAMTRCGFATFWRDDHFVVAVRGDGTIIDPPSVGLPPGLPAAGSDPNRVASALSRLVESPDQAAEEAAA